MLPLTRIDKIPNFVEQIVFMLKQVVMFPIGLKVLGLLRRWAVPVAGTVCSAGQWHPTQTGPDVARASLYVDKAANSVCVENAGTRFR